MPKPYVCPDLCLTIPGKVVEITGNLAAVDYGQDGVRKGVDVSLVRAGLGDYVLVQSGFAVKRLSESEASEVLEMWKVIRELDAEQT
jgi:hydrogenase expression/formation protein HypC